MTGMQTGSDITFTDGDELHILPQPQSEHGQIGGDDYPVPLTAGGKDRIEEGAGIGSSGYGRRSGSGNGSASTNFAPLPPTPDQEFDESLEVDSPPEAISPARAAAAATATEAPTESPTLAPRANPFAGTSSYLGIIPEDDYPDFDDEAPPVPEMDDNQNALEVDEEDNGSVYPATHYPIVPVRYRVERFDAATMNSSSRSLYDDDLDYQIEHGRRYCGEYLYPNDELEQDRLRVLHQVFLNVFDLELTTVELQDPTYILDIGTGTGEWAIGMGELFPDCEVVGVDISAIQPTAVPHNVFFEVDDCEIDWMRPDDMADLVHLRNMAGAFSDWNFVYQQSLTCLKPGGYLEVLDFHDHISGGSSFYDSFPPDSMVHAFARDIDEASIKAGRRRGTHHMEPDELRRLGFVDVKIEERAIGVDPKSDTVSKLWLISCLHGVEALSLRLLTTYMNWEPAQVLEVGNQFCEEIRSRALDPATSGELKGYLRVLTARKPFPGEDVPGYVPPSEHDVEHDVEHAAEHHERDHSEDESTAGP